MGGGPTGLRASGVVGIILMDHRETKIRSLAEQTQEIHTINPVRYIKIHPLHKYVDDCLDVLGPLKLGVRWDA